MNHIEFVFCRNFYSFNLSKISIWKKPAQTLFKNDWDNVFSTLLTVFSTLENFK